MTKSEEIIENHKKNLENSKLEYEKPFPPYEEEYKAKLARQFELNQELDLGRNNEEVIDEDENEVEEELEVSEEMVIQLQIRLKLCKIEAKKEGILKDMQNVYIRYKESNLRFKYYYNLNFKKFKALY